MNKPTIKAILAPKPATCPRSYAYAIADQAHASLLKVGQTTRNVKMKIGARRLRRRTSGTQRRAVDGASRVAVRRSGLKVAPHSQRPGDAHD